MAAHRAGRGLRPFVALGRGESEPFTVAVEPGRYRVEAAVATLTEPEEPPSEEPHLRVPPPGWSCARSPPSGWEPALCPGQDPAGLGEDEFYGYGVDAGAGCFYDAAVDASFPGSEEDEGPLWDAFENSDWGPGPHLTPTRAPGRPWRAFVPGVATAPTPRIGRSGPGRSPAPDRLSGRRAPTGAEPSQLVLEPRHRSGNVLPAPPGRAERPARERGQTRPPTGG